MAKTKRRQLAALAAAKAEGKRLSGSDERITSCQDAGPSGAADQSEPSVEIRTQRVIIKIPPLPVKTPPTAAPQTPNIVRRRRRKALSTALTSKSIAAAAPASAAPEIPGVVRRRRRKASSTTDLTTKSVAASSAAAETPGVVVRRRKRKSSASAAELSSKPADGAKRRRKARVEAELKPQNVQGDEAKVTERKASSKQGGGHVKVRRRRAPAKSNLSSKTATAEAATRSRMKKVPANPLSEQVPEDGAKLSKVILKFGKWKREKTIGELGSQVAAELSRAGRQSRTKVTVSLFSRKRRKVEEELTNKFPAETTNEEEEVAARVPDHTPAAAENGDAAHLVALEASFSEDLLSSPCIGYGRRNRASSPLLTFKRKRGPAAKALLQAPATSVLPEREDISRAEAVANCCNDGFLKSQAKQNSATPPPGDLCTTPSDDNSTVRASKGEATSSGGAQAGPDVADGSADRGSEQNQHPVHKEPANVSCHEDRTVGPMEQGTCQSGAAEEDRKPHWQMELAVPFTPRENGVFLVIKQEEGVDIDQSPQCSVGKDVIPRGAELIKQKNQLAIINKRLDAAGGLGNWLVERGLGQFVPIFDEKKIDTLTLLQITMTELKEMGMIPVGPRRKLIHALSCLTGRSPLTSVGAWP